MRRVPIVLAKSHRPPTVAFSYRMLRRRRRRLVIQNFSSGVLGGDQCWPERWKRWPPRNGAPIRANLCPGRRSALGHEERFPRRRPRSLWVDSGFVRVRERPKSAQPRRWPERRRRTAVHPTEPITISLPEGGFGDPGPVIRRTAGKPLSSTWRTRPRYGLSRRKPQPRSCMLTGPPPDHGVTGSLRSPCPSGDGRPAEPHPVQRLRNRCSGNPLPSADNDVPVAQISRKPTASGPF